MESTYTQGMGLLKGVDWLLLVLLRKKGEKLSLITTAFGEHVQHISVLYIDIDIIEWQLQNDVDT